MNDNGLLMRMCNEAIAELASGDKGWKEADTNTLMLACFGMLYNHLTSQLVRPLWLFAGGISTGVIAYIVKSFMGG